MSDGKDSKQKKKGGMQRIIAGTAGAALGAMIGGIAGVTLVDEKARRKVGETIDTVTEFTVDAVDSISENTDQIRDNKEKLLATLDMKDKKSKGSN